MNFEWLELDKPIRKSSLEHNSDFAVQLKTALEQIYLVLKKGKYCCFVYGDPSTENSLTRQAIKDAEDAVSVLSSNISIDTKERIAEAKDALKSGNSALAKGLANSVIREINSTSEAMNKVQKALRQRKTLESKMPTGKSNSDWMSKLDSIVQTSSKGEWITASKELDYLTSELRDFEEEIKEANELMSFIEEEWISIRKKLDSAGIDVQDSARISIEKNISDITQLLKEGEIQDSLSLLSESDLLIEEIRRRI